ncbi:uncharacterized protein G2W53_026716 [Senna tora]|uniref:Uncharacterized protein n=1 Tax=Senna tora TaxID=362788 RepID=A0A834THS2_9FABA|nr:uncharacterized protein G2W53_026716 [Senna tora]
MADRDRLHEKAYTFGTHFCANYAPS